MPERLRLSAWVWILAAVAIAGCAVLGYYLVQSHQRLKVVEGDLAGAKKETAKAEAGAAELAKAAETLKMELHTVKTAHDAYEGELGEANAASTELAKKLDTAQSKLQATATALENTKRALDQAKAEGAAGERKIADLRQGIASCEEFFNAWEPSGAPASLSVVAALGREAAAAKDCVDKGDVPTACKHWQGLLVEIEKIGPPVSESRGDIEELMRQNGCEALGSSASN